MIDLGFLPDNPVAVLGLGRSGRAAARAVMAAGRPLLAWDDTQAARVAAAEEDGIPLFDLASAELSGVRTLVLSPGIPLHFPVPHPVVERARAAGCEIIGDLELLVRARPDAEFVGITGTNGKSTTTALIGHVLQSTGRRCAIGGNIGVPALDLPELAAGEPYVLEISSYQLELTPSLACSVAVLLNVSPDHLERHGGMAGYVSAKCRIFVGQKLGDVAIVGADDTISRAIADELKNRTAEGRVIPVSGRDAVVGGVFAVGTTLYDAMEQGAPRAILDLDAAKALPGVHNAQNAAAAYAAVRALGVESVAAAAAITDFPGLAHRQEFIAEIDGIAWVNDSKATNPDAAARALACYDSIYWIAGGRSKMGGLGEVTAWLDRIRHAFVIGEAADALADELEPDVPVTRSGTLEQAVAAARERAHSNGAARPVVLLSPACASFDQFENFEARGDAFRKLVEALEQ